MNREELETLKNKAEERFNDLIEELHKLQGEYRAYEHLLLNLPTEPAQTIEVTPETTPHAE